MNSLDEMTVKLKKLAEQHQRVTQQLNDGLVIKAKFEGAMEFLQSEIDAEEKRLKVVAAERAAAEKKKSEEKDQQEKLSKEKAQ